MDRQLTAVDVEVLCRVAGFPDGRTATEADSVSRGQWSNFGDWFVRYGVEPCPPQCHYVINKQL